VKSDIEIARAAKLDSIIDVAKRIGINQESVFNYGHHKAKISLDFIESLYKIFGVLFKFFQNFLLILRLFYIFF
jgi:soluble P-type ATPase